MRQISRQRNVKGQSLTEYAIGLGCVAAVCMAALSGLGHICGDFIWSVQSNVNYGGTRPVKPGRFTPATATPWVVQ